MSFHEVRLPADISFGSSGGPEYFTNVQVLENGFEQRNINWSAPRARYNVSHGVRSDEQLAALIAFFRARKGRAHGFRFKDWADMEGLAQVIGTGDGARATFQLIKIYSSGGGQETRIIKKPVSGTVKVYVNAALQNSGYTVNSATGIITFSTPPVSGAVITSDFEFDVPVRFDTDHLSARLETYGISSVNDVPVIEIRL